MKRAVEVLDKNKYKDSEPIHEKCAGCKRTFDDDGIEKCLAYVRPGYWWEEKPTVNKMVMLDDGRRVSQPARVLLCPLATHIELEKAVGRKVNPLKASKRKGRKK
jgi:hypothetical protein